MSTRSLAVRPRRGDDADEHSLSLPPFTRWVKRLILTYAGICLLMAVMRIASPFAREWVIVYLGLVPSWLCVGCCGN